jgi:RNA 2',3'-cyclic 3'-phosphodiesterase
LRLFFAIELPDAVRATLGRLRSDSQEYRWVEPAGMHVTLAFLGEQPEERLSALTSIATAAASASQRGTLHLGAAGSFGSRRAPRVLWVGLSGDLDTLRALQTHLAEGLHAAKFPVEERDFSPHITLARRRPSATGGAPPGWPPGVQTHVFPLDELTLFESRLSPRGARYIPVAKLALGG